MDSRRPTSLCQEQTESRGRRSPSPRPLYPQLNVRAPSPGAIVDVAPSLPVVISVKECVLRRKSRCTNWGFTLRGTRSGWGKDKWIYNCYVEGVSKNGPAENAALREGDQMVCINGLAVCDMEHSVVVEHFQSCDNVKLLYIPSKYLESSSVRITKQNGSAASYLWAFVKQLHSVEIINIDLSANGKSGRTKIPLSGLNSLRHLSMNHCSLSSLDCLEGLNMLHKLESLSLAHNLLDSEAITRGIATLVQLKKLNLSHNLLNRVPPIISSLKLLESLILANNNIAELPVSLLKLERLQTLCLNGNLLCDIDTLLLHMPQVRNLTLTNNSLDCEVQIARTKDFRIAGVECTCNGGVMTRDKPSLRRALSVRGSVLPKKVYENSYLKDNQVLHQ